MNPVKSEHIKRARGTTSTLFPVFVIAASVLPSPVISQSSTNFLGTSLAELAKPAKKIPFTTIIHATTGYRVLTFDTNQPANQMLRTNILNAARLAGERARVAGLNAARANEAGNQLEPYLRTALRDCGLDARVPLTASGRAQVAGYPDIEITAPLPCYIELKTYNAATENTTQRSFYYSPSESPKITRDALHLLLAYELERIERGGKTVFLPSHWKLLTLENLEVDLKFEFNQSNRGLYGNPAATLDEADLAPSSGTSRAAHP